MKKIFINNNQVGKLNEDAKIVNFNSSLPVDAVSEPDELIDSDDDVLSEFDTLDSLVDDVMEAAAEVRKYYYANKGCFGEEEEYAKDIDDKMNFILSELF